MHCRYKNCRLRMLAIGEAEKWCGIRFIRTCCIHTLGKCACSNSCKLPRVFGSDMKKKKKPNKIFIRNTLPILPSFSRLQLQVREFVALVPYYFLICPR